MRARAVLVGPFLCVIALAGCDGGERRPARADVLIVTIDTLRRDAVGFLGRTPSPSPNLDALAAESVVFADAYTVAPVTLPAHTSLMTGLYPASHGVRDNGAFRVPDAARTLAEILADEGYRTQAAVAAFVLDADFGLDQGFAAYDAPRRDTERMALDSSDRRADEMVDIAIRDLRSLAEDERPFFYWLHLFDPHNPYDAPGADHGAALRTRYDDEVRFADRELGRLFAELRRLGLWDELVVVVASDHGEGLDDGQEPTHGFFVYDRTMRIPLLLRHPGLPPARVERAVSLVDVAPTLLALLGVQVEPARFDGADLALAHPVGEAPERSLAIETWLPYVTNGWAPSAGVVRGPHKYVRSRRNELFDRGADPEEATNLVDIEKRTAEELRAEVEALFGPSPRRLEPAPVTLSADQRNALAALGYAGGEAPADEGLPDFDRLPDPHELIGLVERASRVMDLTAAGSFDEAIAELRELVLRDPKNPHFLERLGDVLLQAGAEAHVGEAELALRRALALRPNGAHAHWCLARCAQVRARAARATMEAFARAGRDDEGRLASREWRAKTAELLVELRIVLGLDPDHPGALGVLAATLLDEAGLAVRTSQPERARELLKESLASFEDFLDAIPESDPRYEATVAMRDRAREMLGEL
ncbi:MAG: sulfatase [Planctomycetota bacterium]|nr:sulfatase [Planctomycetota bacterium]